MQNQRFTVPDLFESVKHGLGPDPLLSEDGWAPNTAQPIPEPEDDPVAPSEPRQVFFDPPEPLGLTFDTDSASPLFTNSAFVLARPRLPEWALRRDLSWHFAKVRFRRRLAPEGVRGFRELPVREFKAGRRRHFVGTAKPGAGQAHRLSFEKIVLEDESSFEVVLGADLIRIRRASDGVIFASGSTLGNREFTLGSWPGSDADLALELRGLADGAIEVRVLQRSAEPPVWQECLATTLPRMDEELEVEVHCIGDASSYEVRAVLDEGAETPIGILESEPTAATWVQWLPGAASWEGRVGSVWRPLGPVTELRLAHDESDASGTIFRLNLDKVRVEEIRSPGAPAEGEAGRIESLPFVLVTERIEDARGREAERFVSLQPFDGKLSLANPARRPLRCRLVEIQRIAGTEQEDIFEQLFPEDPRQDAHARVVRISAPFDQVH